MPVTVSKEIPGQVGRYSHTASEDVFHPAYFEAKRFVTMGACLGRQTYSAGSSNNVLSD